MPPSSIFKQDRRNCPHHRFSRDFLSLYCRNLRSDLLLNCILSSNRSWGKARLIRFIHSEDRIQSKEKARWLVVAAARWYTEQCYAWRWRSFLFCQPTHEYRCMQKKLFNRVNASSPTGATGTGMALLTATESSALASEVAATTSFPSFGLVLAESAAPIEKSVSGNAGRNAAKSVVGGARCASVERSASPPAVVVASKRRRRRTRASTFPVQRIIHHRMIARTCASIHKCIVFLKALPTANATV